MLIGIQICTIPDQQVITVNTFNLQLNTLNFHLSSLFYFKLQWWKYLPHGCGIYCETVPDQDGGHGSIGHGEQVQTKLLSLVSVFFVPLRIGGVSDDACTQKLESCENLQEQ